MNTLIGIFVVIDEDRVSRKEKLYGPELVANGSFDGPADWVLNAGFSIADGKLNAANVVAGHAALNSGVVANTKKYRVVYEISGWGTGSFKMTIGGASTGVQTGNGLFVEEKISGPISTEINFVAAPGPDGNYSVDNISVKEITEVWKDD